MFPTLIGVLAGALLMVAYGCYARYCILGLRQLQRENAAIDAVSKKSDDPGELETGFSPLPNTMRGMIRYLCFIGLIAAVVSTAVSYLVYFGVSAW